MKTVLNLGQLLPMLPAAVRDGINAQAHEAGHSDADKLVLTREAHSQQAKVGDELGPRTAVRYVSARTIDRDNEIVVPGGIDLREFRKYAHVLWGHNYSLPPIGSDTEIEPDEYGLRATTRYADTGEGTLANVVWALVQQGHQKASSIGFVPLAWTQPGHNDWDKTVRKLTADWPEFAKRADKVERVITRSLLLEHSDVSVPANPDANMLAVAKSLTADALVLKALGVPADDGGQLRHTHIPPPPPPARLVRPVTQRVVRVLSVPPDPVAEAIKNDLARRRGRW